MATRPALPEHYLATRVRFEVFVSPFAEPAHAYIRSLVESRKRPAQTLARSYNVDTLNRALTAKTAEAFG